MQWGRLTTKFDGRDLPTTHETARRCREGTPPSLACHVFLRPEKEQEHVRTSSEMRSLKRVAVHPLLGTSKPRVVQQHVADRVRLSAAARGQRLDGFLLSRLLGKSARNLWLISSMFVARH